MGTSKAQFLTSMRKTVRKRIRPHFVTRSEEAFERAKKDLISEVRNHPLSQDLMSHSKSDYLPKGTLFGFLGFNAGEHPVQDLLDFLDEKLEFRPAKNVGADLKLRIQIYVPNKEDFSKHGLFEMRWHSGRSWPVALESGVSGLPYFLSIKNKGHSLEGIQAKTKDGALQKVREEDFGGIKYLTPIFSKFRQRLAGF